MHAEESLLGLSQLLSTADDPLSSLSAPPTEKATQSSGAASSADSVEKHDASLPLPRYLFTFGLSPSGPASAEMLMSLLHHEGTKSLDSRLKECGVKSIGQRLKIQTAVKKALDGTSRVPPAPRDMPKPVACQVEGVIVMTGDVSSIKGPSASDVVRELVSAADDVEALVEVAGQGDRDALTSELKRRGFKTGARYKLEQALTTMASERKTRLAEEKVEAEREVVHQKHLEEQRAEAAVHMEREVKIALAAEEVRVAEEEAVTESAQQKSRLIVVANRLPITPRRARDSGEWRFDRSSGGLVSAFLGVKGMVRTRARTHSRRSAVVGEIDEDADAELDLGEMMAEPLKPVVH